MNSTAVIQTLHSLQVRSPATRITCASPWCFFRCRSRGLTALLLLLLGFFDSQDEDPENSELGEVSTVIPVELIPEHLLPHKPLQAYLHHLSLLKPF